MKIFKIGGEKKNIVEEIVKEAKKPNRNFKKKREKEKKNLIFK